MPRRTPPFLAALLLPLATAAAQEKVTYKEHVRPILVTSCGSCHNPDKNTAGLNLLSYQGAISGSSNGKVLVPGDPDSSQLYLSVTHRQEPKMPLRASKLSDQNLETIRKWIEGGLLETGTSVAMVPDKPKLEMKVTASIGRPKGPPPMPAGLPPLPVVPTQRPAAPGALAASPWAPLLAVAAPRQILLYHAATRDLLGVLPFEDGLMPKVLNFSRNGALLIAGGGVPGESGKVAVYDVATGRRLTSVADELDYDEVLAADVSPDQSAIAFGGPTKILRIYSVETGQPLHKVEKHTDWILSLAYSPDGVLLATGDRNGGLHVWEAGSANEFYTLNGHKAAVTSLRFRADSNVLASASEDGTVRLWDMNTGESIKSWPAHPGGVLSLDFAPDGRLVTAGRDRAVRLWAPDGKKLRDLERMPDVVVHALFADEGKLIAAADFSGELRLSTSADGKRTGRLTPLPPKPPSPLPTTTTSAK
jgi:cytochrome c553